MASKGSIALKLLINNKPFNNESYKYLTTLFIYRERTKKLIKNYFK